MSRSESVLSAFGDLVADLDLDLGAFSPLGNADPRSSLALDLGEDMELGVQLLGLVFVSVSTELVVVGGLVLPLLVRLHIEHLHEVANLDLREVLAQTALALLADEETIFNVHMGQPSLSILNPVAVFGDAGFCFFGGLHLFKSVGLTFVIKFLTVNVLIVELALQFPLSVVFILHLPDVLKVIHLSFLIIILVVVVVVFFSTVVVTIVFIFIFCKNVCHFWLFREGCIHLIQELLRILIDPEVLIAPLFIHSGLFTVLDADVGLLQVCDPVGFA